jgi:hypothetical protein
MIALTIKATDPQVEKVLELLESSGIPYEHRIEALKGVIKWLELCDASRYLASILPQGQSCRIEMSHHGKTTFSEVNFDRLPVLGSQMASVPSKNKPP